MMFRVVKQRILMQQSCEKTKDSIKKGSKL